MITMKACAMLSAVLVLLASLLVPKGYSTVSGGNLWYGIWHQYQYHTNNPENISASTTIYAPTGDTWFNVALVVSVYQYEPHFDNEDMVNFRVALYFDSFAAQGYIPVPARMVTLNIEKDTGGSNFNDQRIKFYYDADASPGYHQGRYLWQTTSTDSNFEQRKSLALATVGFAVGLFYEPVGVALDLINLASSYLAP